MLRNIVQTILVVLVVFAASLGSSPAVKVADRLVAYAQTGAEEPVYKTAICARYIRDLSIPDNEKLKIGEEVIKRWEIENCGTVALSGLKLVRTVGGGSKITSPDFVDVVSIPSRSRAEIAIPVTPRGEGYGEMWFELLLDSGNCAVTDIPCQVRLGSPLSVVITGVQP